MYYVLLLLLLPLLSPFSRVRLCATPQREAHQAPPSLGFSRQEHWSGLPFPSPMHESEKWKWSRSVLSDSSRLHGLQATRLLRPWDFPGKSTGVGCHCLLRYYEQTDFFFFTMNLIFSFKSVDIMLYLAISQMFWLNNLLTVKKLIPIISWTSM